MARTSKTAIFWSFAAGVVVSLIITAGVFIWVNNAPIPFVSKVQQVNSTVDERLLDGKSIDPNEKLYAAGRIPAEELFLLDYIRSEHPFAFVRA